ncbi:MAG: hypothetical protein ABT19_00235 [Rhodanobacter sp. SCN 68-63]|nr:MAG: hypothetical protein ABT19_00235 [Rhodanobacter sp. SCN 68-63]
MAAIQQSGLFSGKPERAKVERRSRGGAAQGYAAKPGTGPAGETCNTCAHCRLRVSRADRRYYKCQLLVGQWTAGRATDVVLRSPACAKWQRGIPQVTTIRGNCDVD